MNRKWVWVKFGEEEMGQMFMFKFFSKKRVAT